MKALLALAIAGIASTCFATTTEELQFACQSGDGEVCFYLALKDAAKGNNAQAQLSNQLLTKACDLGSEQACIGVGQAMLDAKQVDKATDFFKIKCDQGLGFACYQVYDIFAEDDKGLCPSPAEALSFLDKSCGLGYPVACSLMGQIYDEGCPYMPKDSSKATQSYQNGCKAMSTPLNKSSVGNCCLGLGDHYKEGKGVPQSNANAIKAYFKGCQMGVQSACESYEALNKWRDVQ